ncbi:MAG: hypothetical protein M0Z42_14570 [Actinomycetota bacterium]|nr:hypothetical protein [Actinomycetota bacterium]
MAAMISNMRNSPPCPEPSRFAVLPECPHCGGTLEPEHAHYRCRDCGWRDSCCDLSLAGFPPAGSRFDRNRAQPTEPRAPTTT